VEEHVVVRVLSRNETVTAGVVEEINLTFRHCPLNRAGSYIKPFR
jgi:hypothetical protein